MWNVHRDDFCKTMKQQSVGVTYRIALLVLRLIYLCSRCSKTGVCFVDLCVMVVSSQLDTQMTATTIQVLAKVTRTAATISKYFGDIQYKDISTSTDAHTFAITRGTAGKSLNTQPLETVVVVSRNKLVARQYTALAPL